MPAVTITVADLTPFAPGIDPVKAAAMIEDAIALAEAVAPCILDADFTKVAAAKAVLRGAILRWNDAGNGAIVSETVGPFSQTIDTSKARRSLFWPSEIEQLQELCSGGVSKDAFTVDTAPGFGAIHADECSLHFGATYCSCGAALTGSFPLWGE